MPARPLIAACITSCLLLSGQSAAQRGALTVFEHVSVIPMDSERVMPDSQVWVSGSGIVTIASDAGRDAVLNPPTTTVRIDGRGKFLVPMLAEMHAHIPNDTAEAERVLFMYVANGIGTIRSMLGDPAHVRLRERVMRGEIVGPTMLLAGPSFNGQTASTSANSRDSCCSECR